MKFRTSSEKDTYAFGSALGAGLKAGDCVLLKASHFFGRFDLMADFLRDSDFEK